MPPLTYPPSNQRRYRSAAHRQRVQSQRYRQVQRKGRILDETLERLAEMGICHR